MVNLKFYFLFKEIKMLNDDCVRYILNFCSLRDLLCLKLVNRKLYRISMSIINQKYEVKINKKYVDDLDEICSKYQNINFDSEIDSYFTVWSWPTDKCATYSNLSNLKSLSIVGNRNPGDHWLLLTSLTKLTANFTNIQNDHLKCLTNLKYLSIHDTYITDDGISTLTNLEILYNYSNHGSSNLSGFSLLTNLKLLDLSCANINQIGIFKNLKNLETLYINNSILHKDVSIELGSLTTLKTVNYNPDEYNEYIFPDDFGSEIEYLTNVEDLDLYGHYYLKNRHIIALGASKKLKRLNLNYCRCLTEEIFPYLTNLQSLEYYCEQFNSDNINMYSYIANIPILTLKCGNFKNSINDDAIKKLTGVKHLYLRNCYNITNNSISELKQLQSLYIIKCPNIIIPNHLTDCNYDIFTF